MSGLELAGDEFPEVADLIASETRIYRDARLRHISDRLKLPTHRTNQQATFQQDNFRTITFLPAKCTLNVQLRLASPLRRSMVGIASGCMYLCSDLCGVVLGDASFAAL
jgi:hypothetical protein